MGCFSNSKTSYTKFSYVQYISITTQKLCLCNLFIQCKKNSPLHQSCIAIDKRVKTGCDNGSEGGIVYIKGIES